MPAVQPEAMGDRHSKMQPAGSSGPNKDSMRLPDGASALGNEIGGEADARRERLQALAEGDKLPPANSTRNTAADLGAGQLNGQDQGISAPSMQERQGAQQERNSEMQSGQPDLLNIARNSNATADNAPNRNRDDVQSTGAANPSDLLNRVGQHQGVPSRTGAEQDGEILRDAPTNA
ncbi:hypothetical protein BDZ90DRAFT_158143 [Jaminaea rosea]|uniref:Uncharacterized protein n=1 Tax=Jaminaea rosea TaxID=1569628 RepID=A0A316UVL4_9BASI|nr:hypothetical protein BDZ90DRAFT_158143 [Jaminaea rosea]PWN27963.1 hypothetical protein BDZ90DRAFT_158143 [Jaminaea rosea]